MLDERLAKVWTSLPCVVVSVDADGQHATFQPTVKSIQRNPDGTTTAVDLPVLPNVPMQFPGGGGVSMTFPVKTGDEALVTFSSRPVDAWHQQGGVQPQIDARMHDLSDGFAMMGFRSTPRALSGVSSTSTQIRSDDGLHVIDLHPGTGLTLTSSGVSMAMTPAGIAFTGGTITHNGHDIGSTHEHTGVTAGASNTGPPV
jgi:hypothetical protein